MILARFSQQKSRDGFGVATDIHSIRLVGKRGRSGSVVLAPLRLLFLEGKLDEKTK